MFKVRAGVSFNILNKVYRKGQGGNFPWKNVNGHNSSSPPAGKIMSRFIHETMVRIDNV